MKHIFSLGIDYENNRVYDKIGGYDLIRDGGTGTNPIIMEDNTPVLDLRNRTDLMYRIYNESSNNFILNCGTGDFLIRTIIAFNSFGTHCLLGLHVGGNEVLHRKNWILFNNNLDVPTNIQYTSIGTTTFINQSNSDIIYGLYSQNDDISKYHEYILLRNNDTLKFFIDKRLVDSISIDNGLNLDFPSEGYTIGLFDRRTVNTNSSQYLLNGKVKSFDWYKGDLVSFVTTNLKIGD